MGMVHVIVTTMMNVLCLIKHPVIITTSYVKCHAVVRNMALGVGS